MAIYSVTPSTTVLDEGQSISFVITTEEVASGTILYYTLSGDASANDFTDNTLFGSVTVIDFGSGTATGTVTKVISLDLKDMEIISLKSKNNTLEAEKMRCYEFYDSLKNLILEGTNLEEIKENVQKNY
jgi:hypothetical protein